MGAPREVRDSRLYRATHGTFEDYCAQRWEISWQRCYQLIDAATVVENVYHGTQITQPISERQIRPLTRVPAEQQPEVWAAAEAAAPRDAQGQPKITGRIVAEAAGKVVHLRRAPVTLRPAPGIASMQHGRAGRRRSPARPRVGIGIVGT
jgi:hypothetical protein